MKTILFSFDDDVARDRFLATISSAVNGIQAEDADLVRSTLATAKLDPPIKHDHERVVAIYVSGQKLHEGKLSEMTRVFDQETASHTGSVVMKELRSGEWVEIRARRKQM